MKLQTALVLFLTSSTVTAFTILRPGVNCPHVHRVVGVSALSLSSDSNMAAKPVVTRLPDSQVEIQIPVPGTATKAAYDKICKELSKTIVIPGFRRGSKIPPAVLEQAMSAKGGRNAIKIQAINELLVQLVEPSLKEQNLDPIGKATLKIPAEELADSFQPGEPLTLPVQCDVWPDIEWKTPTAGEAKPYVGLKGKYTRKPFDQAKLDLALRDLKERYTTLEPIDDDTHVLQMGDACTINMVGYLALNDGVTKGDPLPNAASGDNVEVVLGEGRYMAGLVEGLVGEKVGETKTVAVSFPKNLRDKTLAGKRAVFDVEILKAATRIIPELTDEFANKVKAGMTKDKMLEQLRSAIDEEDKKEFVPARNKALGEALAEVFDVQVPDTLVTNQAREKFAVMMADMRSNGVSDEEIKLQINPENFGKYKDIVRDDIVRDFKVSMATDEIARLEGITVPDYQFEEQMEAIKKDAGDSEEFDENMIRAKVKTTMERQAVFDWLADRAILEVEYKTEEFDEKLMQQLAEESLAREQKMKAGEEQGEKMTLEAKVEEVVEPLVVEAVVDTEEPKVAPVTETPPSVATPEDKEAKYAEMSLAERAFQILVDTGGLKIHQDPNSPDYDHSSDNDIAEGIVQKS